MPFVPLRDGRSLYVRIVGAGEPVVLLPGLGMSSAHWLPFVLPFARRFRFHLPDFRGQGRSAHLHIDRSDVFESHALDVRDAIAHLGLRDFLLGGISLGATTALHMHRSGGLADVRRYLHIDQSPFVGRLEDWEHGLFGPLQDERFRQLRSVHEVLGRHPGAKYLSDLPREERHVVAEGVAALVASVMGRPKSAALVRRALLLPRLRIRLTRLDNARAYLAGYLSGGHDYRESLRTLTLPVTVMIGMRSELYSEAGQMLVASGSSAPRIVRFENSGHAPLIDEPRKFVRELGLFLEGAG
jgi:pimeloyl-ACP methyl ester carboxylesterase